MKRIFFFCRVIFVVCIFHFSAKGQDNVEKTIFSNFDAYRSKTFQEKVYVHTDRSYYVTGDYVWLKLVVLESTFHKPSTLSKVAYIEILDAGNNPVVQAKIALTGGKGNAALFLPASLNSGNYTMRAYTRWMKNFSTDLFFSKRITIVNTFKPLEPAIDSTKNEIDLQFFPEGGDLVSGLKSKVAFRMVDQSGEGMAREGFICDSKNDTIAVFSPLKFGIGHFYFTPKKGESYHAIVRNLVGGFISKPFPEARNDGYVINLTEEAGKIIVTAYTSNDQSGEKVYLFVHTRNENQDIVSQSFQNGEATFILDKNNLKDGVSHLTLFDSQQNPVCERLFFKQPAEALKIDVKLNATKYFPRRKMILEIETSRANQVVAADLSVSAYRLDTLQSKDPIDIQNYAMLTSDLVGSVESPDYYFSDDRDVVEAVDNLMLTHGWRRFEWKQILKDEFKTLAFIPEYRGHIIEGSVNHISTKEKGLNMASYLSVAGRQFHFRGSKSNREGKVYFEMGNFFGERQLIVQTNTQVDSMFAVAIDNPFSTKFSTRHPVEFNLSSKLKNEILRRSINMQMANAYYDQEQASRIHFKQDSVPFFGSSDAHYRLDDYTRFPVMEEVMREYVPSVFVRKRKGDFHFMVVNKITNELLRNDPLVLLDGVPIFDTNKVMALDPLLVETLDVVSKRYYFGSLSFDGIVSYTTYGKETFEFPIGKTALIMNYNGMEYQRKFFSPVYEMKEQKNNRIPDYRDLLYWSPTIITDGRGKATVSFYTSDQTGAYLLNIQGLTDEGDMGSTSYRFDVDIDNN